MRRLRSVRVLRAAQLPRRGFRTVLLAGLLFGTAALEAVRTTSAAEPSGPPVSFSREIRPILSDRCFTCHGPDEKRRQAELRLDVEAGLRHKGEKGLVVSPGHPESSELLRRVTVSGDERMPPPDHGPPLAPRETALLKRWIEQGAKWEGHWAFLPLQSPPPTTTARPDRLRGPLDAFVLERLERDGLSFSPEAPKTRLIRRVTLDLTGLPPTPAEVEAFVQDDRPDAYERVVDRLLASPRFGERMAFGWLDAARYADTSGYQSDGERTMWRWRDWVLEAFDENLPFDRFTLEQNAGDLLPNPTLAQRIATGFHRNHRGNAEGGIIPEEYAVEYVVDRVETTATVWLGLTMGCARCHDHKYDPLRQTDFYRLFAYFHNVPENGRAVKIGNSPPMILSPTKDQARRLAESETRIARARAALDAAAKEIDAALAEWDRKATPDLHAPSNLETGVAWEARFDGDLAFGPARPTPPEPASTGPDTTTAGAAGKTTAKPANNAKPDPAAAGTQTTSTTSTGSGTAEKEEQQTVDAPRTTGTAAGEGASFEAGVHGKAVRLTGSNPIEFPAAKALKFGFFDRFAVSFRVRPDGPVPSGAILSTMEPDANRKGWEVRLVDGRVQANFCVRWLDDSVRIETTTALAPDRWQHVAVTYDGSRLASGIRVWVDGVPQPTRALLDALNQNFASDLPLSVGRRHEADPYRGLLDDLRIFARVPSDDELAALAVVETPVEILALPAERRTSAQRHALREHLLTVAGPDRLRAVRRERDEAVESHRLLVASIPTTMVMEEMPAPRPTHVLIRGEYDKPGARVEPGVPGVLPGGDPSAPPNRLGLARWLVDPRNPLPARVFVNRVWQMSFGTGLVKTTEDFGSQGEIPSHPELLDWLAGEFVRTGWDVKTLRRTIVTSATYRQDSRTTPALAALDPENRRLARGPRVRLPAEIVRDQALAAAGLLVERRGGPSVKPYQPEGLWKEIATDTDYVQDHGAGLYRRSLYTYWKRTVAPPGMVAFDASTRETCVVRATRTNTPLQALALLNDVAYVEAARGLARRMLTEAAADDAARIAHGTKLLLAREPTPAERRILSAGLERHRARFRSDPDAVKGLLSVGESPVPEGLDRTDLAAFTALANVLLNLDEAVTLE